MNPMDNNTETEQELEDKLMDIKDLREAIQIMKDSMLLKADNPFIGLQYVATKKHGGNLHHILKGDDSDYHVIKNNRKSESPYSISVRKGGKEVQRSPNHYMDIHEVTKALMSYHKNKKWGADDIVKSIFDHVSLQKADKRTTITSGKPVEPTNTPMAPTNAPRKTVADLIKEKEAAKIKPLDKAKIDSTFEPESRNKLREIRNIPKDLSGTNEGYSPKGVNKPVAMQRRAHEVVQFAKQSKPNLPKSELDKAGVHEEYGIKQGWSKAGHQARRGQENPVTEWIQTKDSIQGHKAKLKELKAMPKPNLPKVEEAPVQELDKGSKNVREQKKNIFGSDANAPRMSDKRAKMMGAIKQYAEKQYKLPLQIASGKRDESGELRTDKENQPAFDIFTPKGREAEKQLLAQQKVSGVKRVDAKPDWRSGNLETQPSPDAAIHELAHLNIAPEKMDIATFQEHMDDKWGASQSKYGHMQQKKTHGEIQPMSVENSLRRQMGLPANRATKPVTENQRALDYEGDRFVQGKDAKGKPAFYDRQTRLQTPETKDRLEQIKQGTVKFNPKTGWEPANDTNALINLRGQGKHKEAADRLRSRMALANPTAKKAEGIIGTTKFKTDDKDLPQHQAAINAEKYADIKVDEVKKSMNIKKPTHISGVPIPKELHSFVHGNVAVPGDHPHREMAAKFVGDIWKQNKMEGKRMSGNLLNVHAPELQAPASTTASKPAYSTMKNDQVHPEGTPEDKAHDAIEQDQTVSDVVDHNSESALSKIFTHLKEKKSNPDWARSPENMNPEDMEKAGVHSAIPGSKGGMSEVGYHARRMVTNSDHPASVKTAKQYAIGEHADKLKELKSMSKPNLPKSEEMKMAEGSKVGGGGKVGGASTSTTGNKTRTGGSNPGGASTGGAGTVTITARDLGPKGITVSNVGGKTDAKNGGGMDPSDDQPENADKAKMPIHEKLKKQLKSMQKVDENTGLPGTVLDKARVDEGLSPQVKNQARFYRNKPLSPGSLNERITTGVHKPAFGAKTGTSNMGAVSNNNTRKEQTKRVTAESKAMPKPNLPKSEELDKAIPKVKFSSNHDKNSHLIDPDKGVSAAGSKIRSANRSQSWAKDPRSSSPSIERSMAKDRLKEAKGLRAKSLATVVAQPKPNLPKSELDKSSANPPVRIGRAVKDGKEVGHLYEHSLAGAKVRRGDIAGAKQTMKESVAEVRTEPKPNLPKSEDMEKRCWEGYKAVPGKKAYSEGSCTKDLGKSKGATTAHKVVLHALKSMPKPNLPKSEKVTAMDKDRMVHVSNDPKVLDKKNC